MTTRAPGSPSCWMPRSKPRSWWWCAVPPPGHTQRTIVLTEAEAWQRGWSTRWNRRACPPRVCQPRA